MAILGGELLRGLAIELARGLSLWASRCTACPPCPALPELPACPAIPACPGAPPATPAVSLGTPWRTLLV